jgi:class 3 adenylate cyclase
VTHEVAAGRAAPTSLELTRAIKVVETQEQLRVQIGIATGAV